MLACSNTSGRQSTKLLVRAHSDDAFERALAKVTSDGPEIKDIQQVAATIYML